MSLLHALRLRARAAVAHEPLHTPLARALQPVQQQQHHHQQYQRQQQHFQHVTRRQLHASVRRHAVPAAAAAPSVATNAPLDDSSTSTTNALLQLDERIAQRQPAQALALFQQLREPPSTPTLQKLALLLAKQKNAAHVASACEILLSVYRLTGLVPDDYTKLASIHVVDACLRNSLLDRAVETYEEAFNQGVFLDLPAYDALLQALVAADRTLEAVAILNEVADEDDVAPPEHSYLPLLMALVSQGEYEGATDLLEKGQGRGVTFTGETFHPLVERVEKVEEPTDALVMLLTYIEDIWEDAKLFDELADLDEHDLDEDEDEDDNDESKDRDGSSNAQG